MPTKREREYYRMGFLDGQRSVISEGPRILPRFREGPRYTDVETIGHGNIGGTGGSYRKAPKPKRKLSAWNKFVKANSKKPRFVLRSGKLNLKKMGVAFRKTPAGKKKRR